MKKCKFCGMEYPPMLYDKDVCSREKCQQKLEAHKHKNAVHHYWQAHDTVYHALKNSPLAKLPTEFGSENIDIAFHRFCIAGIQHHNKTQSDDKIDELLMWQPDQYLNSLTSGKVGAISATFHYFARVVNESGVPWVKPLYEELNASKPVTPVKKEVTQLLLDI